MFHFVHTDLLKWGSCQKRRIGPYIPSFPHPFLRRETGTTGDTLAIDLGSGEITAKNQLPGRLWAANGHVLGLVASANLPSFGLLSQRDLYLKPVELLLSRPTEELDRGRASTRRERRKHRGCGNKNVNETIEIRLVLL